MQQKLSPSSVVFISFNVFAVVLLRTAKCCQCLYLIKATSLLYPHGRLTALTIQTYLFVYVCNSLVRLLSAVDP